jgi:hypothetical protein
MLTADLIGQSVNYLILYLILTTIHYSLTTNQYRVSREEKELEKKEEGKTKVITFYITNVTK